MGTGYFLARCQFPCAEPRIALMDLNENSLEFAQRRIARYKPEIYRRNVLEPIHINAEKFDSVAINYLLHCLPGSIESKSVVLAHLKALMNPNAVIYGSTILSDDVARSRLAKWLMDTYNKRGIFSNQNDDLEGFQEVLAKHFGDISLEVVGCVTLFSGRLSSL
ncbi:class I SAM-dependent methyltransferase [Gloeothece verrucosa]|uniref:class I SAM-dependent methyltransferase n=1 Tax=Gloeothece verrucosa TaxID=2546359 RepID=UPI00315D3DA2